MINLQDIPSGLPAYQEALDALKCLLEENGEIFETPGKSKNRKADKVRPNFQNFFMQYPCIFDLIGDVYGNSMSAHFYLDEPEIFGEFRADYLVADKLRKKYLFIEIENATKGSIFKEKSKKNRTRISYEWSSRFEKGMSQIVDWCFRFSGLKSSSAMIEYFGRKDVDYCGLLVIGRDQYLDVSGLRERYNWRIEKTIVDSRKISVVTFDQLFLDLRERLGAVQDLAR